MVEIANCTLLGLSRRGSYLTTASWWTIPGWQGLNNFRKSNRWITPRTLAGRSFRTFPQYALRTPHSTLYFELSLFSLDLEAQLKTSTVDTFVIQETFDRISLERSQKNKLFCGWLNWVAGSSSLSSPRLSLLFHSYPPWYSLGSRARHTSRPPDQKAVPLSNEESPDT